MARKVIKKKAPLEMDKVLASRSRVYRYASENFKTIAIASSVIGVLFILYIGWTTYSRQRESRAADAFYSAMKVYRAKVDATATAPDAFRTEDEKYRAVINKFVDLSKSYKGSNAGSIALFYAANAYYNMKEYDRAIELYGQLLTGEVKDPNLHGNIAAFRLNPGVLRDSALYALAHTYEKKGDFNKAIDPLTFLTSSEDTHLREAALTTLGRLYEKGNDRAKASETYQKIISEFPDSPNITRIKEKVEGLKG